MAISEQLTRKTEVLSAQERIRRARLTREATVNVALEGFTFSPEQDADVEALVRGELTPEEVTARTLARHVRRPD